MQENEIMLSEKEGRLLRLNVDFGEKIGESDH